MAARLRDTRKWPPNGFTFIDAPINPQPYGESYWDFETLVANVIARRKANPRFGLSTNFNDVRLEVDIQIATRVSRMPNTDSYWYEDNGGGGIAPVFPVAHRNAPLSVAGTVKAVTAGIGVLTEWLGSGAEPVPMELANQRASICVSCPQNNTAKNVWDYFTDSAASLIRKQIEIKNELTLTTQDDARLGTCEACTCVLKLKVHTPMSHILSHTSEEVRGRLDARCWVLSQDKG